MNELANAKGEGTLMAIDLWNLDGHGHEDGISPIAWYEGLQLLPQHFQQWDARLEGLLRRMTLAAAPFSWGIDRLVVDELALSGGTLRLQAVSGQFPDGVLFAWNARGGVRMDLPIAMGDEEYAVTYAIALPSQDFIDSGVRVERSRQVAGAPVADRGDREEKAVVLRLEPNLCIRRWDPNDLRYAQIPIIRVLKTSAGYQLGEFHPPAARLLPGSACMREVVALTRALRAKARELDVEPVPPLLPREHRNGLAPVQMALVAGVPRLEARLSSGTAHPYDVLLSLCDIAGAVSSLAGRVPDFFPPYDHNDPAGAIFAVAHYISRIVHGLGVDRREWTSMPFALEAGRWTSAVPGTDIQQEILLRVTFSSSMSEGAIASWLDHTLICWESEEQRCREFRVRGLSRRQHVSLPELGLPAIPWNRYAQIQVGKAFSRDPRQKIVIGVAGERDMATIESVSWMVKP